MRKIQADILKEMASQIDVLITVRQSPGGEHYVTFRDYEMRDYDTAFTRLTNIKLEELKGLAA